MSTYQSWNFSSVSFQKCASRRFCTSWAAFFVSRMNAYGVYLLSRYGGIFWVMTEYTFDILIDPNLNARLKNTPQLLWVRGKLYSTVLSEKCHGSWKKEKYNPWYIKYKVLNENWIFCTKEFNKTAKQIVQFSSWTFGRSPYFIKAIFSVYYLILFSYSVIYFITRILGYKLGLLSIPKYPDHYPKRLYPGKIYQRGNRYKNITLKKQCRK